MCIIISKPAGVTLGKATLKECWESNPDGAGYMFAHKGKLIVKKGFMKWKPFWTSYRKDMDTQAKKANMVIHFRITSAGGTTEENCHPFIVNKGLAMAHNGHISNVVLPKKSTRSDTHFFVENILKMLDEDFLYDDAIVELIEGYIGSSKLCFLNNFGEVTIINEYLGEKAKGCWFSNDSYKKMPNYVTKGKGLAKTVDYYGYGTANRCGYNSSYAERYDGAFGQADKWDEDEFPVEGEEKFCLRCAVELTKEEISDSESYRDDAGIHYCSACIWDAIDDEVANELAAEDAELVVEDVLELVDE